MGHLGEEAPDIPYVWSGAVAPPPPGETKREPDQPPRGECRYPSVLGYSLETARLSADVVMPYMMPGFTSSGEPVHENLSDTSEE